MTLGSSEEVAGRRSRRDRAGPCENDTLEAVKILRREEGTEAGATFRNNGDVRQRRIRLRLRWNWIPAQLRALRDLQGTIRSVERRVEVFRCPSGLTQIIPNRN